MLSWGGVGAPLSFSGLEAKMPGICKVGASHEQYRIVLCPASVLLLHRLFMKVNLFIIIQSRTHKYKVFFPHSYNIS